MPDYSLQRREYYLPFLLLAGLYGFIVALTGFKEAWELAFSVDASSELVQSLLDASLSTPYSALLSGIVITSLIQSSSANIGTTITNTLVGLAQGHQPEQFKRMAPAILVDDVYKILVVALFFLIENLTGLLHWLSVTLVGVIERNAFAGGFLNGFPDVIDIVTAPVTARLIQLVGLLPISNGYHALVSGLEFFALLVVALNAMGFALKDYLEERSRAIIRTALLGKPVAFGLGFALCWMLQSSSVTISLILPLVAQSAIALPTVYYYSIGAALATTCDAGQIISYLKFGALGLSAGLVHILLNVFGALLFLFVPGLKTLPLLIAEGLAEQMCRFRYPPLLLLGYVALLFFLFPMLVIAAVK
jgi:sodium-dependent phosphate cotransporter